MTSKAVLQAISAGQNEANGITSAATKTALPASPAQEIIRDFEDAFGVITGQAREGLIVFGYARPDGGSKYKLLFNRAANPTQIIEVTAGADIIVDGENRTERPIERVTHIPTRKEVALDVIRQISKDAAECRKQPPAKRNAF